MSEKKGDPPWATHRDGSLSAKIWRNESADNGAYYSVTFQKIYTDKATGEARETRNFTATDLLKLQPLAMDAYKSVGEFRQQERQFEKAQRRDEIPVTRSSMAAVRDAAMKKVAPKSNRTAREAPREL